MPKSSPELHRSSRFSYVCNGCGRCCYGKLIPLTPYEVLRLARNRGLSTTDFLARHTQRQGVCLAHRKGSTACTFLSGTDCTVHEDRPLACRLYPLGRLKTDDGSEVYFEMEPHPETEGIYGNDGTVDEYLREQDVEPFLEARRLYADLYHEIEAVLATEDTGEGRSQAVFGDLLDVDAVVEDYCQQHGLECPTNDIDNLVELHLAAVREVLQRS